MTFRYSMALRNAALDARIAAVGPSPILKIAGEGGTELAVIQLPETWMTKAKNAFVTKAGDWQAEAKSDGTPAVFRIYDRAGTCHIAGAIPGEMTLDTAKEVSEGQLVSVEQFVIRTGNG